MEDLLPWKPINRQRKSSNQHPFWDFRDEYLSEFPPA